MSNKPLDERIYTTIKKAITTRELLPGTKLSEEMLANVLKVSRTPIRAALQRLSYERLVNIIPHKGAFVAAPTVKEVTEAFEMRVLLEEYALEKAFVKLNQQNTYLALSEIVEAESRAYVDKNFEQVLERVRDFHIQVAHLAENAILEQHIRELIALTNTYLLFFSQINEKSPDSPKEHRLILEAIQNNDLLSAKKHLRNHLESILKRLNFKLIEKSHLTTEEIFLRSFQY